MATSISQDALKSPLLAVITAVPIDCATTSPLASTVAIKSSLLLHVTVLSVAVVGETVAVSCTFSVALSRAELLFSVIPDTGVGMTLTLQVTLRSPQVAVMSVLPTDIAVTKPFSVTVAMLSFALLQETVLLNPSLPDSVAVSWMLSPALREMSVWSMVIDVFDSLITLANFDQSGSRI